MEIGSRSSGGIITISVSTGGAGYTSAPTVSLGGGGASAVAQMAGTVVSAVAVVNPGSGYSSPFAVTFSGGGGSGAAATAYAHAGSLRPMTFFKGRFNDLYGVDGMGRGIRWDGDSAAVEKIGINKPAVGPAMTAVTAASGNYISGIQIVAAGVGYQTVPTVKISGGTPETPATAAATVSNGRVSSIKVTNPGTKYQSAPSVTIAGGIGTGASFGVSVIGRVGEVSLTSQGTGYTSNAATSPTVVFSSAQGLTQALATVSVDRNGRISSVFLASGGTGATTGVTASIVGGGGIGASLSVQMAYRVSSVTAVSAGTGYMAAPVITFRPAANDPTGSLDTVAAAATALVNSTGGVTGATVYAGGNYGLPPIALIVDTQATATATLTSNSRGKYFCCFRYLDDTPEAAGGPIPSSISHLTEVDAGEAASGFTWTCSHAGIDDRVSAMELWRTTSDQSIILFRVATIQRTDAEFTTSYSETLTDKDLQDTKRSGYGLMPVTLPSGQINARRFDPPPGNLAVGVMFQDRAWYAVDTTGRSPNSLFYSEIDEPESVPLANELVVQENTATPDQVVALIPLGSFLLIAQRTHLYKLTYVAQPVLDASLTLAGYRGILNNQCWDAMGGVAFIVDSNGMYAFDGNSEESISVPVDNLWRDGTIDFSKASQFHVSADFATKTIRFYYCTASDSAPTRALCYCVATKAWWEEQYSYAVTATSPVVTGGKYGQIYATGGGSFVKEGGLQDPSSTPVPYLFRSGPAALADEDGSRSVSIVYRPTTNTSDLQVRLHYNNSSDPRANAIATDRGSGFTTATGATAAVLDMKKTRSSLGDSNGFARAYYSGRNDPRSAGGDRHMAVAIAGTQAGTTPADAVVIYGIAVEGAK
jgi:hypothetical protein